MKTTLRFLALLAVSFALSLSARAQGYNTIYQASLSGATYLNGNMTGSGSLTLTGPVSVSVSGTALTLYGGSNGIVFQSGGTPAIDWGNTGNYIDGGSQNNLRLVGSTGPVQITGGLSTSGTIFLSGIANSGTGDLLTINTVSGAIGYTPSTGSLSLAVLAAGGTTITGTTSLSAGLVGTGSLSLGGTGSFGGTITSKGLNLVYNTALYSVDGTLSNYSANNAVYLVGNAAGYLSLQGDGTQYQTIRIFGGSTGSISFTTTNVPRMYLDQTGLLTAAYGIISSLANAATSTLTGAIQSVGGISSQQGVVSTTMSTGTLTTSGNLFTSGNALGAATNSILGKEITLFFASSPAGVASTSNSAGIGINQGSAAMEFLGFQGAGFNFFNQANSTTPSLAMSLNGSGVLTGLSGVSTGSLSATGTVTHSGPTVLGSAGTSFSQMILGVVTLSSGVATVTNSSITSTSTGVWFTANGASVSGTIGIHPYATVHSGSFSVTATATDNSAYIWQAIVSPAIP